MKPVDLLKPLGIRVFLVSLVYLGLAKLSYELFFYDASSILLIWLPSGWLVAILILSIFNEWWAYICGAVAAALLFNIFQGHPFSTAAGFSFIDVSGSVAGAWLLRRFSTGRITFTRFREIFALFLFSGALIGMSTASLMAAIKTAADPTLDFIIVWAGWAIPVYMGISTLTPLIVTTIEQTRGGWKVTRGQIFEGVFVYGGLLFSQYSVFYPQMSNLFPAIPLFFFPIPFLGWAALRFGVWGTAWAVSLFVFEAALFMSIPMYAAYIMRGPLYQQVAWDQFYYITTTACLWILTIMDHERKQAAKITRQSEERFRMLIEQMPVMLNAYDVQGIIIAWNRECERITGFSAKEIVGNPMAIELLYPDPEYRARMLSAWADTKQDVYEWEWEITCKDGSHKTIAWSNISTRVAIPGWSSWSIGVDVTSRRHAEKIILKQTEELISQKEELTAQNEQLIAQTQELISQEAVLRRTEDRLLRSQSVAHIGSWELNLITHEMWGSPEAFDIYGLEITPMLSLPLQIIQSIPLQKYRPIMDAALRDLVAANKPYNFEFMIRRVNDEEIRAIHTVANLVSDKNGKPSYVIGTIQDITERKLSEDALRQSEENFSSLLESSPIGMSITDTDGQYIYANQALCEMLGYTSAEMLGLRYLDISYPDSTELAANQMMRDRLVKGEITNGEIEKRLLKKDGSIINIILKLALMQGFTDEQIYFVAQLVDITARRRSEEALRINEERLDLVLQSTNDGIWDLNIPGNKAYFSPRYYEMLGYEPGAFPANFEGYISMIHPDDIDETAQKIKEYLDGCLPKYYQEFRMKHKNGGWRWILGRGEVVERDENERPVRMVGTHTDITERKTADEALRKSEERFRLLSQYSPFGMALVNPEGGVEYVNPRFTAITGYTLEDIPHQTDWYWKAFPDEEYRRIMIDSWEKSLVIVYRGESVTNVIYRIRCKDGTNKDIRFQVGLFHDQRALVTLEDITDQRRAEEALRESQDQFATFMDNMPAASFLSDYSGRTIYVNRYFTQIFGENWLGKYVTEMVPEEIARRKMEEDLIAIKEGFHHCIEAFTDVHGNDRILETIKFAIRRGELSPLLGGISLDITEREYAEQALRRQSAYLEALYETTLGVINNLDVNALLKDLVQRAAHLVGSENGFIYLVDKKNKCLDMKLGSGIYETMVGLKMRKGEGLSGLVWKTGQTINVDDYSTWKNRTKKVTDGIIHASAAAPLKSGEEVIGILGVGHTESAGRIGSDELTLLNRFAELASVAMVNAKLYGSLEHELQERKKAEEEVRTLNAELERRVMERTAQLESTNRELEAFSYSVSHDLRAPLRSIDGFSQALYDDYYDKLDEPARHHLKRVLSATQRMGDLMDALLQLSRLTRGELRRRRVDLSLLAEGISEELHKQDEKRRVKFIIQKGMIAHVDDRLIQAALVNLLDNAWKFTADREEAIIEFKQTRLLDDTEVFYVRDNGAGFDMTYADKLFGAFQRLHTEKEFSGTGIGLATVQRIIHRHGGRIWAESEINVGTVFYFTLP
jgi:PAS domain S-box-containing protein